VFAEQLDETSAVGERLGNGMSVSGRELGMNVAGDVWVNSFGKQDRLLSARSKQNECQSTYQEIQCRLDAFLPDLSILLQTVNDACYELPIWIRRHDSSN
jgi:hypothetical protein